jgi:hypothetical protein
MIDMELQSLQYPSPPRSSEENKEAIGGGRIRQEAGRPARGCGWMDCVARICCWGAAAAAKRRESLIDAEGLPSDFFELTPEQRDEYAVNCEKRGCSESWNFLMSAVCFLDRQLTDAQAQAVYIRLHANFIDSKAEHHINVGDAEFLRAFPAPSSFPFVRSAVTQALKPAFVEVWALVKQNVPPPVQQDVVKGTEASAQPRRTRASSIAGDRKMVFGAGAGPASAQAKGAPLLSPLAHSSSLASLPTLPEPHSPSGADDPEEFDEFYVV